MKQHSQELAQRLTGEDGLIPMYVMTSEHTKGPTQEFFRCTAIHSGTFLLINLVLSLETPSVVIKIYLMSSLPRKNNFFGMKEEQLIIFEQRTIPAFDMNVRKTFDYLIYFTMLCFIEQ